MSFELQQSGKKPVLSATPTKAINSIKKATIIKEVAEITGLNNTQVRAVLEAFTDLAQREMIVNGVWNWPGLPTVTRHVQKSKPVYYAELDKTLMIPEQPYLTAKIPQPVKDLLRLAWKEQLNEMNGTTRENWWEPYYYADGYLPGSQVRQRFHPVSKVDRSKL